MDSYKEKMKVDIEFDITPSMMSEANDEFPEVVEMPEGQDTLTFSATVLASVVRELNDDDADTVRLHTIDDTISVRLIA